MSQCKMKVTNADDIEIELAIKMTLGDWKVLEGQLEDKWPSCTLGNEIRDMLAQATQTFYPNVDEK